MNGTRRAIIDIGTNSVKLLVAEVANNQVQPVEEQSEQTRLGRGFYRELRLQPQAIARTARAVAAFADRATRLAAVSLRVIATSAARDARNPQDLIQAVEAAAPVRLEIISGEQEAEWAYHSVASDPRFAGLSLFIMDTGGGSTQLIYHDHQAHSVHHSFPLGSVRLLERFPPSDPPQAHELAQIRTFIRDFIHQHIQPVLIREWHPNTLIHTRLVGTGGSSSLLAAMRLALTAFDRERLESTSLAFAAVRDQLERLWSLSLADRKRLPGLPPPKADVALMGVAIHEGIMDYFHLPELWISTRGLRFAALMDQDCSKMPGDSRARQSSARRGL